MVIKVTQEDIDKGNRDSLEDCPIALALVRELKLDIVGKRDVVAVYGKGRGAHIWRGQQEYSYKLPKNIEALIEDFDSGDKIEPFEFEMTEKGE
jgi:hypothetical protein